MIDIESTRSSAYIDIRARVYRHSPIRLRFRLPKSVTNPACTPSLDHLRPQVLYAMGPFLSRRVLIDITNWAAREAPKGSNHKWATLVSGYFPVVGIPGKYNPNSSPRSSPRSSVGYLHCLSRIPSSAFPQLEYLEGLQETIYLIFPDRNDPNRRFSVSLMSRI